MGWNQYVPASGTVNWYVQRLTRSTETPVRSGTPSMSLRSYEAVPVDGGGSGQAVAQGDPSTSPP